MHGIFKRVHGLALYKPKTGEHPHVIDLDLISMSDFEQSE